MHVHAMCQMGQILCPAKTTILPHLLFVRHSLAAVGSLHMALLATPQGRLKLGLRMMGAEKTFS